jgi:CBS domain-containing protein
MLRAAVWKITGDRHRARVIAARAGQFLGSLLVMVGFFESFFVPDAFTSGLWLAFIGWFMVGAAGSERRDAELRRALDSRPLRRFTSPAVDPIPAEATVEDAVDGWFDVFGRDAFFVAEEPGPVIGVLTLDDVRRVPLEARQVPVTEAMRPIDALPWLDASTPASAVLDRLEEQGVAVVFDDGEPIGLVTRRDVLNRLRRDQELGRVPAGARR